MPANYNLRNVQIPLVSIAKQTIPTHRDHSKSHLIKKPVYKHIRIITNNLTTNKNSPLF